MATAFTLFPLLPVELRLQIWQHTFPPPRRIRINRWTPGPAALYVSHEARELVKQFYDLVPRPIARRVFSCYGWMNLPLDIIDGSGIRELHYMPGHKERCQKIRYIHMDVSTWSEIFDFRFFADKLEIFMVDFANLVRIDVFVHEHSSNGTETVEDIIAKLNRKMTEEVKELEVARSLAGETCQPPAFTVDLCPLTKSSIDNHNWVECSDAFCEVHP